jgi:hypothetical protein
MNHAVINAYPDVFHRLGINMLYSYPEDQARKIDNITTMIRQRIHSTDMDQAMSQHNHDQGSVDEDILEFILEALIEQPDNCFNWLSSFAATADASMQFSAVLPMGRSTITRSSQPIPYYKSNSNCNDITNITRVDNTVLLDGVMCVEGAMFVASKEWCQ